MIMRSAFVTVGTTSFDALIRAVDTPEFLNALAYRGITRLTVQIGRGTYIPDAHCAATMIAPDPDAAKAAAGYAALDDEDGGGGGGDDDDDDDGYGPAVAGGVRCRYYRYRRSLRGDVAGAALVVSHAGAGSIVEALRAGRPLITVVNDALMDNHQVELAEAMRARNYLYRASPADLARVLRAADLGALAPYPPVDGRALAAAFDATALDGARARDGQGAWLYVAIAGLAVAFLWLQTVIL